jgi:hypothetical protein
MKNRPLGVTILVAIDSIGVAFYLVLAMIFLANREQGTKLLEGMSGAGTGPAPFLRAGRFCRFTFDDCSFHRSTRLGLVEAEKLGADHLARDYWVVAVWSRHSYHCGVVLSHSGRLRRSVTSCSCCDSHFRVSFERPSARGVSASGLASGEVANLSARHQSSPKARFKLTGSVSERRRRDIS